MKRNLFIAAAAVLCIAAAAAPFACTGSGAVIQGVSVDGVQAGGMTRGEVEAFVREKNEKLSGRSLTVEHGAIREVWPFADLGVKMDAEAEAARLLALGRDGGFFSDWAVRWEAILGRKETHLRILYDRDRLEEKIAALAREYSRPPEASRPVIGGDGSVTFTEGRPSMKIDTALLWSLADAQLLSGQSGTVLIPVQEEKKDAAGAEAKKKIDRVLAEYTTYFSMDENRCSNIARAAASIDGRILMPGESFSFNEATGLRTKANGYLDAPVFIDGKLVPDAGGGVCQVSTTLFNAVLLAGLAVTERTCHFAPVAYVPIGQDATVADKYLDFRFVNTLSGPVYIQADYEPGALTVRILGSRRDEPQSAVVQETECKTLPHKTVRKVDPSQKEEKKTEEGSDGCDATVIRRVTFSDGSGQYDSFRSVYDAVDTVITYNSEKAMKADIEKENAAKKAAAEQKKKKETAKKAPAKAQPETGPAAAER